MTALNIETVFNEVEEYYSHEIIRGQKTCSIISLASINKKPSKFSPFHFCGSQMPPLPDLIPIPQTLSYGLASTRILSLVPSRYCFSSGF